MAVMIVTIEAKMITSIGKENEKKNIAILRNSMIMHLKGYKMSKKVGECKVFVKSFGRAI